MGTMTKRQACLPRLNAAAPAGAQKREWPHAASAFARAMPCAMALSDGTTGIGGNGEAGRAFLAGDDI
jgi:hypothetical protein